MSTTTTTTTTTVQSRAAKTTLIKYGNGKIMPNSETPFYSYKTAHCRLRPALGGGNSPLHSLVGGLERERHAISWLYVPVVGNSAHSRYGKSRNCVWSEGAVGNALSRDSRYFLAFAITGNRGERFLGIPTLGRENFFIRERQLFSETKLNNKSPLQSLLFILEKVQSESQADFLKRFTFL